MVDEFSKYISKMSTEIFKLLQHYKSHKLIEVFVARARVGPVIREEAANVTSQAVKSTKSLLLCILTNNI